MVVIKYVFLLLISLFISETHSQVLFGRVVKYDKYQDVVWDREARSLVTKTDSTIVIETKTKKPVVYRISEDLFFKHGSNRLVFVALDNKNGYIDRDSIMNIIKNTDEKSKPRLLQELSDQTLITFYKHAMFYTSFTDSEIDMVEVRSPDGTRLLYRK